jgi:ATP-binding cassette, subfamily B, bacterial
MQGHRRKVIIGLVLMTFGTMLALIPPIGTKLAIDCVLTDPPSPIPNYLPSFLRSVTPIRLLFWIAGAVIIVTLMRTTVHLIGRWLATQAVNQMSATLRRKVFEHALDLPLHDVHRIKSGGITSLLREDAGGVSDLIFSMLFNPLQAVVQLIGSLIVLVVVDWRLMVAGFLILPAVYFSHRTWIRSIRPLYRDVRGQRQTVDASARQKSETVRFTTSNHLLIRQQLMVWLRTRLIEIVWEVLIPLSSTLLLIYGGYQILQGELTLGELMMFLVYLTMLLGPIATLAGSAVTFQNNLAGLDRVLDLLQTAPEMRDEDDAIRVDRNAVCGSITIENLSFRYPESTTNVLTDINLEVIAGQTIAFVGRSGAGKTTLCNLIARFYDPQSGSIRLDGIDLKEIQLQSYRRLLGVVEQDVFLFDGTIAENIAYGRRNATIDEIESAAKAAAAHEFILATTNGYRTIIGERGVKLSGGQRQRLAIARAMLADPKILILDEATSNLDSESEQLIQRSLARLLQNRTAFVIAHRLSTIMHADQIVVLDQGQIIEVGTHDELMSRDGQYRKMVSLQTEQSILITNE